MSEKIVFLDASTVDYGDMDLSGFNKYGDFMSYDLTDPEDIIDKVDDATIVITNKVVIDKKIIDNSPNLKMIAVAATGYNIIDTLYAGKNNISVANVAGYSTYSVAQLTLTFMLALSTNLIKYNNAVKAGSWFKSKIFTMGDWPSFNLEGKTLGILGLGSIGRKVATLSEAFGMNTTALHREGVAYSSNGIKRYKMDDLLEISDFISIHMPLSDFSEGLVDSRFLSKMKKSAYLINMARGQIIQSEDLAKALNNKVIAGAAIDVLDKEPPERNNPLFKAKNIIITPHIAWASAESRKKLVLEIEENIKAFCNGEKRNIVN